MRVVIPSVLVLALPVVCTTLDDGGVDVGMQANHEVTKDTTDTVSWASFLSPSYILEGIQNADLPSFPFVADGVWDFAAPKLSPSDFWEMAKKSEENLRDYAHHLLEAAANHFKSTKFTDITSAMNHIVNATTTFRDNIKGALDARHVTLDTFTEELEGIFMTIVKNLEDIPPPDKVPGHAEREEMVNKVLDDAAQALVTLATRYGIEEEVVTTYLFTLRPHVQALIVVIGDINEQYPQLLPILTSSVTALLIPESWILKPLLGLLGFGPAGPVKGSIAAWSQRYFWGATVPAGSWFSLLQAAGMGAPLTWGRLVDKAPPLIGGALKMLWASRNGG